MAARYEDIERSWGSEEFIRREFPTWSDDEALVRWWASYSRRSASPGAVVAWERMDTRPTSVTSSPRSMFPP